MNVKYLPNPFVNPEDDDFDDGDIIPKMCNSEKQD